MTKKKKTKKKSTFGCLNCFSTAAIDCDELISPAFGNDSSDFQYVIENGAIRKVPRKLLQEVRVPIKKSNDRGFNEYVVKKVPPDISIGPVVYLEDTSLEKSSSYNSEELKDFCEPATTAALICTPQCRYPQPRRPGVARTYYVETKHAVDDSTVRQLLKPSQKAAVQTDNQQEIAHQILADVHKTSIEEDATKSVQAIPTEIKEAIEALKVAKPLHSNAEFTNRNRRSVVRASSTTSLEKETLCNILNTEKDISKGEEEDTTRTKIRHNHSDKINVSSSTSDFPENAHLNNSSDLQSSENAEEIPESPQGQSLKWKIIINKHNKDKNC